MTDELWTSVDNYFSTALGLDDPALEAAHKASEAGGLPPIAVSACQGSPIQRVRSPGPWAWSGPPGASTLSGVSSLP